MPSDMDLPEEIEDLPPSAELVYRLLRETDEATINELDEETCCGRSTIFYALEALEERDVVERKSDPEAAAEYRWRVLY